MTLITQGMLGASYRNELNAALPSVTTNGKKLAIIGDSIDVSTWQQYCIDELNLASVINTAAAGARHNDNEGGTTTADNLATYASVSKDNVLANQVRRLVQDSFASGQTITWTHPVSGYVTSISSGLGTGLGLTPPDLIIIKMGQNGGQGALTDSDFNTVIGQAYSALDRLNQFSSMRWAIETLQICFPLAPIFIASNYQSASLGFASGKIRSDISERMAKYMNCIYINTFEQLGVNVNFEVNGSAGRYLYDGTHPGDGSGGPSVTTYNGKALLGKFFARRIKQYYQSRV